MLANIKSFIFSITYTILNKTVNHGA